MQMVIFCGGLATRLGNLAKEIPKSMIRIKGKPFLEYQIDAVKKQGITDIVLCVGHLAEHIQTYFKDGKKFGVHLNYSHDGDTPLGPIGALKKAEPLLQDAFFIMYGDSYLTIDYQKVYSYFLQHHALALMIVYKNDDKYDKSNIVVENNRVVEYGTETKNPERQYIDYGASLLKKQALNHIPANTFSTTAMFFSDIITKKQLLAYEATKRFYHIGTPEALHEFRDYVNSW